MCVCPPPGPSHHYTNSIDTTNIWHRFLWKQHFIVLHLDFLADATDGPKETHYVDNKVWEEVDRLPEAEVGDAGLGGERGDKGGGFRGQGGEAGEGGGEQGGGLCVKGGEVWLLGQLDIGEGGY